MSATRGRVEVRRITTERLFLAEAVEKVGSDFFNNLRQKETFDAGGGSRPPNQYQRFGEPDAGSNPGRLPDLSNSAVAHLAAALMISEQPWNHYCPGQSISVGRTLTLLSE